MVKQKLTSAEEKKIEEQLKQFIKPTTLPDILRKAILENKWFPDKYQIYVPAGDFDKEDHFITAEDAIKDFENDNMTELDKLAIRRIMEVPKISDRLDYKYRGLVTRVKNTLIEGMDNIPEEKVKLHQKSESLDLFGDDKKKKKPEQPKVVKPTAYDKDGNIIDYNPTVIKPFNKHGGTWNDTWESQPERKESEDKKEEKNDNADEKPYTGNISVRRRNDSVSEENTRGETKTSRTTKSKGIDFGEDEDY